MPSVMNSATRLFSLNYHGFSLISNNKTKHSKTKIPELGKKIFFFSKICFEKISWFSKKSKIAKKNLGVSNFFCSEIPDFWHEERGVKRRSKSILHLDYSPNFHRGPLLNNIWAIFERVTQIFEEYLSNIWTNLDNIWTMFNQHLKVNILKGISLCSISVDTPRIFFEVLSKNLKFLQNKKLNPQIFF